MVIYLVISTGFLTFTYVDTGRASVKLLKLLNVVIVDNVAIDLINSLRYIFTFGYEPVFIY
jgi:hypothetical protein